MPIPCPGLNPPLSCVSLTHPFSIPSLPYAVLIHPFPQIHLGCMGERCKVPVGSVKSAAAKRIFGATAAKTGHTVVVASRDT